MMSIWSLLQTLLVMIENMIIKKEQPSMIEKMHHWIKKVRKYILRKKRKLIGENVVKVE